jgi:glucose 1-dehydrogenase
MKAIAIFPETHEVKLIDHEEPRITTPTQVKLRTLEVGVCGTDKKITSFQFGSPPPGSEYLVIGHEMLGEVVEVGSQVYNIKPGDLAVTMVRHLCPHEYCRACRAGPIGLLGAMALVAAGFETYVFTLQETQC